MNATATVKKILDSNLFPDLQEIRPLMTTEGGGLLYIFKTGDHDVSFHTNKKFLFPKVKIDGEELDNEYLISQLRKFIRKQTPLL